MTATETIDYLHTLPTTHALWWFIENVTEDDPIRTEVFFYLRERFRSYQADPKAEHRYEGAWRKLADEAEVVVAQEHVQRVVQLRGHCE